MAVKMEKAVLEVKLNPRGLEMDINKDDTLLWELYSS